MSVVRLYLRQMRRKPSRLIPLLVVGAFWLLRWFVEESVGNAAVERGQTWLAGQSKVAESALHFIAVHWWWIPWILVPIGFLSTVLWIGYDTRSSIQGRLAPMENLTEQSLHERAKTWISAHARKERTLGIKRAYLFGSILHYHYPTSDVDLLVVYKPMAYRGIKRLARHLKEQTAPDFKLTFGHRLHLSFVCASDEERLARFLMKAGKYDSVDI